MKKRKDLKRKLLRGEKRGIRAGKLALLCLLCGCGSQPEGFVLTEVSEEISREAGAEPDGGMAEEAAEIYVYVCGAVKNPGVVCLAEDSRADAALAAAGGFSENAATDAVNLAARLTDGEMLYFPTEEEAENSGTQDARVNINTADKDALCTLPGIGASKAEEILRYREENGRFESCEDMMLVPGIGTGVYEKLREKITVK